MYRCATVIECAFLFSLQYRHIGENIFANIYIFLNVMSRFIMSALSRLFMLPWNCQLCLDSLCCLDAVNLVSLLNVALILSTLSRYFMLFWFCQPCIDNLCCLDTINLISIVYVVSILSTLFRYFMLYWYSQPCIDTLCCLDTVNCVSILCWCDCCQSWAQNQY